MSDDVEDRVGMALAVPATSPLGEHWRVAQLLARSHYFKDTDNAAQVFTKILAGDEMGFGPIASMKGIFVVNEQVTYSSNIIAAAIQKSGKYRYRVVKLDKTGCTIKFFEKNGEGWEAIGDSSFGGEDAVAAGLTNNATYTRYPRNMYFARALTNGARWYCAEVFGGGVYTPDEFGAAVDDDGEVISIPAAPPMDTEEQKRLAQRYTEIHGEDDVSEQVRALVMANATLLQQAKDLGVPGYRPYGAQASWSAETIAKANAELTTRIRERNQELDQHAAAQAGQRAF